MEPKLRLNTTSVCTFVGLFFLYATSVFALNGGITEKSVSPSATAFLAPSVIVSDNFAGSTPTYMSPYQSPNFTGAPGLSANGIAIGGGVTGVSAAGSYSAYGWNQNSLDEGPPNAQTDDDYYEWVITPQAGKEIDFNQLVLQITRGNNGNSPKNFVLLASTAANFGSPVSLGALNVANNASSATLTYNNVTAFASFQNVQTAITFRLYSFGGGAGTGHTFNVVSYAFTGEVFDLPTCNAVSQEAVVCEGTPTATIVLSGLLPNSVSTVSYTIGGGPVQTATGVVADGSGTATFALLLEVGNDSQTLAITNVVRTDLIGVSPFTPSTAITAVLEVDPLLTWYLDADTDGYYTGEPVLSCDSPGEGYTLTVTAGGDCNDNNADVNPGATEVCFDNIDNDCDGSLYNGCAPVVTSLLPIHDSQQLSQVRSLLIASVPTNTGSLSLSYRFRVTNMTSMEVDSITNSVRDVRLTQLTTPGFVTYDTWYSVEVAAVVNGEVQPYNGVSRLVKTPSIPVAVISQCGTTLPLLRSSITFNSFSIEDPNLYEFRVSLSSAPETYEYVVRTISDFRLTMLEELPVLYGTTYLVSARTRVSINGVDTWSDYSVPCAVTTTAIPTPVINSSVCGQSLTFIRSLVATNAVPSGIQYEFRVSLASAPSTYEYLLRPIQDIRLTQLEELPILYGTTYLIAARVFATGAWSDWGATCAVTTPAFPTTNIVNGQCETVVSSYDQKLYAIPYFGAEAYRFRLRQFDGVDEFGPIMVYEQELTLTQFNFQLSMFTGLLPGTAYEVSVSIQLFGEFGPYGNSCYITTPGTSGKEANLVYTKEAHEIATAMEVKAYPNPFRDAFTLDLTTSAAAPLKLAVYDMTGRLLESKTLTIDQANNTSIGSNYPTGVYNVVVTQGEEVKMIRVVKQ